MAAWFSLFCTYVCPEKTQEENEDKMAHIIYSIRPASGWGAFDKGWSVYAAYRFGDVCYDDIGYLLDQLKNSLSTAGDDNCIEVEFHFDYKIQNKWAVSKNDLTDMPITASANDPSDDWI